MQSFFRNSTNRSQAGDTIVEVLIATVIVSSVLVGAFSIANRSSVAIRAAQERSQAVKLTASAIETLKANSAKSSQLTLDKPFCQDLITNARIDGGVIDANPQDDSNALYNPQCKSSSSTTVDFYTSITRIGTSSLVIHTRWDRINGGDRQDITMYYKVDQ